MLIRRESVKNTFTFIISDPEVVFPFCFKCLDPVIMLSNVYPFLIMNFSFYGNQIGTIVPILLLKTFF